ncbi:MAG: hypothetical protein LUD72_01615 [Bacteroidales bacterium]|nr:hypothetical protein [Bacteroidales bacterium]
MKTTDKNVDNNGLYVIYVHYVGVDSDGLRVYHLLVSENPDDAFGEAWGEKPACNCVSLMPPEKCYEYIKEVRTDILLDLAQDECCHSMQDARDNVVSLASENLDDAEEYPDDGRIVVQFGQAVEEVDAMFARRDVVSRYI